MNRSKGSRHPDLGVVRRHQPQFQERRTEPLGYVSSDREDPDSPGRENRRNRSSDTVLDHNKYVWIRVEAVEAIRNNHGSLPEGWKPPSPRKRGRTESSVSGASFDWVRAVVDQSSSAPPRPSSHRPTTTTTQAVLATLTVQDEEFAPPHLRNATVSLSYDPGDLVDPLVCDANTWWNTRGQSPPEDLTSLLHLHEPEVVYCLKERYHDDSIYTYTGKILLAMNPFRSIQGFYGEAVMEKYWQANQLQRPPPHVYVIAQDAYRSMLQSMGESNNADQSILVSGESGSGKSVTTKIIMGYLAAQSQRTSARHTGDVHRQGIESQLLQSNPILESFGNARTVRNDNSSRFGKFMELIFTASGTLASASIETYLLEKVRIISQAPGERNYHIFYEILAGLPQCERQALRIGNVSAKDFRMTASSGTYDRRDGVDDRETYQHLRKALDTVGFSPEEQLHMITVICALLHTSNIEFAARITSGGEEGSQVVQSNALLSALELLGVPLEALASSLCVCVIEARGEVFHKNLTVSQSIKACEALIKATYGALFTYIVKKINRSIAAHLNSDRELEQSSRIGVLDIFGFESFTVNSFEQLCINYCNEALQQQFNRFIFKLEQEEYDREGIEWAFISFPDNQDVLDLIERRREGILSILDDQCRVATCSDASFCRAVHDKCKDHGRFVASMAQRSSLSFTVHHYAGPVTYDTRFFLEKNKDELPKETTELLTASSLPFISYLGDLLCEKPDVDDSPRPASPASSVSSYSTVRPGVSPMVKKQFTRGSSSLLRESVGSQFSYQLKELRRRIDATTPHYVRCLKPNDDLVPDRFDPHVIADQLRCAGVLEVIRVSRVGFPHRFCHDAFTKRYGLLSPSRGIGQPSGTSQCSGVVKDLIPRVTAVLHEQDVASSSVDYQEVVSRGMQMGHSKVFLRRQVFEGLEYLRNKRLGRSVIVIQKHARRFLAEAHYFEAYFSAVTLQSFGRMLISKRIVSFIRDDTAALKIQCAYRRFMAKTNLFSARLIAQFCQAHQRGAVARQLCGILRVDKRAMLIQRCWRRYRCQSGYARLRAAAVTFQCFHRQRQAIRLYKRLCLDARDLNAVLAERDHFKQEMMKLKKEVELLKHSSLPGEFVAEQVDELPRPDRPSMNGSEVDHLRAEVARLQAALARQSEVHNPRSNDQPPQSVIVHRRSGWSLFGAKKDDTASHTSSLENDQSPLALARRSHPNSAKKVWNNPDHRVENQATVTPQSKPSVFNPGTSSSSVSLLDAERYTEMAEYQLQVIVDTEDAKSPSLYSSPTSPIARLTFEDDPLPVAERRGMEFTEDLRCFHQSIFTCDHRLASEMLRISKEPHVLVNEIGNDGRAALHTAVEALDFKTAKLLIDYGAFVNAQDMAGDTPLHLSTDAQITTLLLEHGKANPNIPNLEGICVLHSAVQRMDIESVRLLLTYHAKVDTADNLRWFTPLHLATLPASGNGQSVGNARIRLVELLCSVDAPDLNSQDSEGNTPLHYAVQIESQEADSVIRTLLEKGASPRIINSRNQGPLLLLCHNSALRRHDIFQDCLHTMLLHGANPNDQSRTGATPLHLCLYNKDVDGAVQLVRRAAELHVTWQKPPHWLSFWNDMGDPNVLPLDMVTDDHSLHRIVDAITKQPRLAPSRSWCMQCKVGLGSDAKTLHCGHCGRYTCTFCCRSRLTPNYFPKSFVIYGPTAVCLICEKVLVARKEDNSSSTVPLSASYGDEDDKLM